MANDKDKHALYLVNPDTQHVELVHSDDVDDRKADGWKQPTNHKPNGEEYNREDDFAGQDLAAEFAKTKAEAKAKKDAKDAKEAEDAKAAADKEAAKADKSDK